MLLEISGEITPERMKKWSQSKNNTQLWMGLVTETRFNAVKSNIASVQFSHSVVSDSLQPHSPQPHQAPLSMGFSRQEHWSGLAFPSAKGTIERKKVKSLSCVQLCDPLDCSLPGSPIHGIFQAGVLDGLPFPSP